MTDLWKAFEQILHGNLLQACTEHGFPLWLAKLQVSLYRLPRGVCLEACCSGELSVLQTVLAGDAFAAAYVKVMPPAPLEGRLPFGGPCGGRG
eukprot:7191304-Pyramimonas_sp.AAC.2